MRKRKPQPLMHLHAVRGTRDDLRLLGGQLESSFGGISSDLRVEGFMKMRQSSMHLRPVRGT